MRDNCQPPKPFDLPCAATAAIKSKKSKMMRCLAPFSTLIGMNVLNESLALWES